MCHPRLRGPPEPSIGRRPSLRAGENPLAIRGVVEVGPVGRNGDISMSSSVLDNGRRRSSWMACSSRGPGYMIQGARWYKSGRRVSTAPVVLDHDILVGSIGASGVHPLVCGGEGVQPECGVRLWCAWAESDAAVRGCD